MLSGCHGWGAARSQSRRLPEQGKPSKKEHTVWMVEDYPRKASGQLRSIPKPTWVLQLMAEHERVRLASAITHPIMLRAFKSLPIYYMTYIQLTKSMLPLSSLPAPYKCLICGLRLRDVFHSAAFLHTQVLLSKCPKKLRLKNFIRRDAIVSSAVPTKKRL